MMAVVTNIDADHLETHGGDFEKYKQSFVEFLHHLPFYGQAIICLDDVENKQIPDQVSRPIVTYGIESDADVKAENINCNGMQCHYDLKLPNQSEVINITLNLPGRHNVLNSLAAITVAYLLGVEIQSIQKALQTFDGIGRRMQQYGEIRTIKGNGLLVDDYGHHPTEIKATLEAAKGAWSNKRIVVVFQPHRYTRTRDLFEDFSKVLSEADTLIITGNSKVSSKRDAIEKSGVKVIDAQLKDGRIDLDALMNQLGKMGITSLLIEGGAQVAASALQAKIVDKINFFYAPKILGGDDGVPMCSGTGPELMAASIPVRDMTVRQFDNDIMIEGYLS